MSSAFSRICRHFARPGRTALRAAVAGLGLFLLAAPIPPALAQKGDLVIGALLPLTGPQADRGATARAALEFAQNDIRDYLVTSKQGGSASILVEDTAGSPAKALDKLKALAGRGARLIIGPISDDEVEHCLEYADKNGILLLSQGSGANYLAKKGDNLFRLTPSNTYQSEAITSLARQEGAGRLIFLWRGDRVGDELVVHLKARFKQLGGESLPGTRYDPDRTDFTPILADLAKQVAAAKAADPRTPLAVVFVGGDEVVPIFREAARQPDLAGLRWYGSDRTAHNDLIARDQQSADFAMKVRFVSPRYGETGSNVYEYLDKRIQQKTDLYPDPAALASYDAAWLLFYAAQNLGGAVDVARIKQTLPSVAERMYGVTGWLAVNEYGDRREDWDFDFWKLGREENKYFWDKAARYQFEPATAKELFINSPK